MKDSPVGIVKEKPSVATYDFSDLKCQLDILGLKSNSSSNKLTIEFKDEEQIKELLIQLNK